MESINSSSWVTEMLCLFCAATIDTGVDDFANVTWGVMSHPHSGNGSEQWLYFGDVHPALEGSMKSILMITTRHSGSVGGYASVEFVSEGASQADKYFCSTECLRGWLLAAVELVEELVSQNECTTLTNPALQRKEKEGRETEEGTE